MSQKNKMRFLVCFLFSIIAHSGVLVASLFYTRPIAEDPQGATLKAAAEAQLSGAQAQPQTNKTLHSVELVDVKDSKIAIPDSVQTAELAQRLPEKVRTVAKNDILMAKENDPTAIEIKKPIPAKKSEEILPILPVQEKKSAKAKTPKVKKEVTKTKLAKLSTPKPVLESVKDDMVVEQPAELTPVTERVDAEASEDAPVVVHAKPEQEKPVKHELKKAPVVVAAVEEQTESADEEVAAVPAPAPKRAQVNPHAVTRPVKTATLDGEGNEGMGSAESTENIQASGGKGSSPGGAPGGIRDGDSLAEIPGNLRPLYPLEDRRARREGVAVFIAKVTPDGRVQDIKLEASATPLMNSAAQKAFAGYHYKAGQEGWIRKKFIFKITGEAEEPTRLRRTTQSNSTTR